MIKKKIELPVDVWIPKGVIFENVKSSTNYGLGGFIEDVLYPKGTVLQKYGWQTWITTTTEDGLFLTKPVHPELFDYIYEKALNEGAEPEISEDNKDVWKVFDARGMYMTEFIAESKEKATAMCIELYGKESENFIIRK
jgi:hypothetical protein